MGDSGCKLVIGDPQRLELCAPFAEKFGLKTICVRGEFPGAASWDAVLAANKGKKAPKNKIKAGVTLLYPLPLH